MPDTEVLPAVGESPPAAYALRRDRCVVEPSIRLARLPVLRGRLTATGGHLDADGRQFVLVLDATTLRTGAALLRRALTRALRAGDHPEITFTSEDIEIDPAIDITGKLDVAGATRELRLRGDLRPVDDDRIVLWAKGTLPAPRRRPRRLGPVARLLAGRRIHVEIAAEFVR